MINKKIKIFFTYLVGIFLVIISIVAGWFIFDLEYNLTDSYPTGIYKVDKTTPWQKGDLVVVCPPNNDNFKKNYHGYLATGKCTTGTIPLLKKIVAVGGINDTVTVSDYVYVNEIIQNNSKIQNFDSKHIATKPCYGKHIIKSGYVWIMSDYNEKSFDSRYFCEVPATNVIGKAKLLIEF